MTTTPTQPRPRHFQEDLLKALADLTGGDSTKAVPFKDTYDPVCDSMGIDFDSFGTRDSDGKPWTGLWILGAFRALKDQGLTAQHGRGLWGITEDGLKKVTDMTATTVTTPDPTLDPENGESLSVGPGNDESGYHPDPHIRSLAADMTACFGYYSDRGSVCKTCSLIGPCQNLVATHVTALAAKLAQRDEEAKKAAADPIHQIQAPVADPTAPATPSTPAGGWDNTDAQQIISYMDAKCYRCGDEIKKDEECYWIKPNGGTNTGLFHLKCH